MPKLQQNLVMFKGDDLPIEWLHVGPAWQTNREVISIEAADEIEWRMCEEAPSAENLYDPTVVMTKTRAGGDITVVTSGLYETNDTIRVQLDSDDTDEASGVDPGEYYHEIIINYGGTDTVVVGTGFIDLRSPAGKRGAV